MFIEQKCYTVKVISKSIHSDTNDAHTEFFPLSDSVLQ